MISASPSSRVDNIRNSLVALKMTLASALVV